MSRSAVVVRETKESDVRVELTIDGTGQTEVDTGVPFYDHMLHALGKHAGQDLLEGIYTLPVDEIENLDATVWW